MSRRSPNVLLITSDQHRGDCLGIGGNPVPRTPNLDAIGQAGLYFPNAYSAMPVCVAARSSIMTGLVPASWGMRTNGGRLLDGAPKLPGVFAAHGYRTQGIGKMHFTPWRERYGFHDVVTSEEGRQWRDSWDDYELYLRSVGWGGYERAHGIGNNDVRTSPSPLPREHYHTTWCAQTSIDWLHSHRRDQHETPFFLWTSFTKPHSPYDPPEPFDRLYNPREVSPPLGGPSDLEHVTPEFALQRQRYGWDLLSPQSVQRARAYYYGNVGLIDHEVGRLMTALRDLDLWENTVVLFTSDHGDLLGDHGLFFKSNFFRESWHIPFLLAAPWLIAPHGVVRRFVGLEDVMPTLLGLAGLPVPSGLHGTDVMHDLDSGPDACCGTYLAAPNRRHAIRTREWQYMVHENGAFEELYDVQADPAETRNLASQTGTAEVRAELRRRLAQWLREVGDPRAVDGSGEIVVSPEYEPGSDLEPASRTPLGLRPY